MSDSFLDSLPSKEREKIRKRLRSPEAYAALREKVKGPEDLEREMDRSERLAELQFEMETDPAVKEKVKGALQDAIRDVGVEGVVEEGIHVSEDAKKALEQGDVIVAVSSHPTTHEDALTVAPEGNVQEKLPVKRQLSDQWTAQFVRKASS
jgi:hypothetical protein